VVVDEVVSVDTEPLRRWVAERKPGFDCASFAALSQQALEGVPPPE
jgi:hypothetical protein